MAPGLAIIVRVGEILGRMGKQEEEGESSGKQTDGPLGP
jgi:hypothetical protein